MISIIANGLRTYYIKKINCGPLTPWLPSLTLAAKRRQGVPIIPLAPSLMMDPLLGSVSFVLQNPAC